MHAAVCMLPIDPHNSGIPFNNATFREGLLFALELDLVRHGSK